MEDNMANRVYQYEQKRGQVGVIKEYFEMAAGDMRKEGRDLSVDDKLELAQESAKALGLKAHEVSFPLD
jgi:hypothetical protein